MGLNAEIIAIGQFSEAVASHLEYAPERYANTDKGSMIISTCFFVEPGTSESYKLAECFGIEPWNFNQHKLNPHNANLLALEELCGKSDVDDFVALRNAGFQFFFKPNG